MNVSSRCVLVGLLLAGCSPDPVVGTWRVKDKVIELRDGGRLVAEQFTDPACASEKTAIADCAAQQRWERSGSGYRVTRMVLTQRASGGLGGAFDTRKPSNPSNCDCVVDLIVTAELHGDELVFEGGKERAQRVK